MSAIDDKLARCLDNMLAERARMVANVRRAYQDGRWQAATRDQRALTRRHFGILNARLRRTIAEIERRAQR